MTHALTDEQVNQVVTNTMVVILARSDLLPDWHANLMNLLTQTRDAGFDEEMFFVGAVLTLLHSPNDTLPTGTIYDPAWRALLTALQTGVVQPVDDETETVTIDQLVLSVAQAVVRVLKDAPNQAGRLAGEIREMRTAAVDAGIMDLIAWLDDAIALLEGKSISDITTPHTGIFHEQWQFIVSNL